MNENLKKSVSMAYLLGSLCSDASVSHSKIRLCSKDYDFIEAFKKNVKPFLVTKFVEYKANTTKDYFYVQFTNRELIDYILETYGKMYSKEFVVPIFVKQSRDPKIISAFLQSFFDSDGSVDIRRRVRIQKVSSGLFDIKTLLEFFHIHSRVRTENRRTVKGNIVYELSITGTENLRIFSKEIGFAIGRKQKMLEIIVGDEE